MTDQKLQQTLAVQIYSVRPSVRADILLLQSLLDTAFRELRHGRPLLFVRGLVKDVISIRALCNFER
jgi:hypothetical protein